MCELIWVKVGFKDMAENVHKTIMNKKSWKKIIECHSLCRLFKWHIDEMTSWWNGKLTKWHIDEMECWWNDKLTKWKVDKMAHWWNYKLMKWLVDKMASWHNDDMTRWSYYDHKKLNMFLSYCTWTRLKLLKVTLS